MPRHARMFILSLLSICIYFCGIPVCVCVHVLALTFISEACCPIMDMLRQIRGCTCFVFTSFNTRASILGFLALSFFDGCSMHVCAVGLAQFAGCTEYTSYRLDIIEGRTCCGAYSMILYSACSVKVTSPNHMTSGSIPGRYFLILRPPPCTARQGTRPAWMHAFCMYISACRDQGAAGWACTENATGHYKEYGREG